MTKILVVDDSSTMRRIHQRSLEKLGFSVIVACDGVDALSSLVANGPFDLVLTDIHMPNMDGLTLTEKIRENPSWKSLKVLVVTSDGTLDIIERAVRVGAHDVLIKPFTPDEFSTRVKALIDG